jgi:hypothetical protein
LSQRRNIASRSRSVMEYMCNQLNSDQTRAFLTKKRVLFSGSPG